MLIVTATVLDIHVQLCKSCEDMYIITVLSMSEPIVFVPFTDYTCMTLMYDLNVSIYCTPEVNCVLM